VLDSLSAQASTQEKVLPIGKDWGPNLKAVVWLQGAKSREVYGTVSAMITR
jgi:hypothetical protein